MRAIFSHFILKFYGVVFFVSHKILCCLENTASNHCKMDKTGICEWSMECFYYFLSLGILEKLGGRNNECDCKEKEECEDCGKESWNLQARGQIKEREMKTALEEIDLYQLLYSIKKELMDLDYDFLLQAFLIPYFKSEITKTLFLGVKPYIRLCLNKREMSRELTNRIRNVVESSTFRNKNPNNGDETNDGGEFYSTTFSNLEKRLL